MSGALLSGPELRLSSRFCADGHHRALSMITQDPLVTTGTASIASAKVFAPSRRSAAVCAYRLLQPLRERTAALPFGAGSYEVTEQQLRESELFPYCCP